MMFIIISRFLVRRLSSYAHSLLRILAHFPYSPSFAARETNGQLTLSLICSPGTFCFSSFLLFVIMASCLSAQRRETDDSLCSKRKVHRLSPSRRHHHHLLRLHHRLSDRSSVSMSLPFPGRSFCGSSCSPVSSFSLNLTLTQPY